jgi:transposase InsO family protein
LVDIFNLFGYPRIISHDNGKEFTSNLFQSIIEQSGIDERLSLPFNPLGNATNEAFVKKGKRNNHKDAPRS